MHGHVHHHDHHGLDIGPTSRIIRFIIPRAGLPESKLDKAV